ncbi:MAG TPA: VPLPA-CTERM sorting domain-containing protein [Steroidobacteraceae bacterium]|nr:VPLPA-CTERM sorting domain-containing protein [Steroidobacteraceae bacterium]
MADPRLRKFLVAFAALIAATVSAEAPAATIPSASVEVTAEGGTPILTFGTVNGSGCNGLTGGCESSTASAASNLDVSTSGSNSGPNPANAAGSADITAFYEIVGPAGNIPVTLYISGSASTSASGPDTEALAYIMYSSGALYTCSSAGSIAGPTGPCGSEPNSGSLDSVLITNAYTNELFDLSVQVSGSTSGGPGGSFSALVDPVLTLDSTWLADHPGYSLEFSSNVSPVPLPAAAWLLLSGLGGLGAVARKKRKRAAQG